MASKFVFVLLVADKFTIFAVVIAVVSKLLALACRVPVLTFVASKFDKAIVPVVKTDATRFAIVAFVPTKLVVVLFVADKLTTFAVVIAVESKLLELA